MERTKRPHRIVVRGVRWVLPWIGVLVLSASLGAAMNFAVSSAPAGEPEATNAIAPAALCHVAMGVPEAFIELAQLSVRTQLEVE